MSKTIVAVLSVALMGGSFAGSALADDYMGPNAPNLSTKYGASVNIGGGVLAFTDDSMRDFANTGGAWEARGVIGTRQHLAVEAAYTGAANEIDALGLDSSALLLSTGLEALARYNVLTKEIQPYIAAGVGWRRYDVTNADFNTSSVSDEDNLVEIPVAAGVSYRYRGLVVDLRTMLHVAFDDNLIAEPADGTDQDKPNLHTWSGQLTAGFEF